jgi:putative salt-induced outer membrane protein YdiY
MTQALPSWAGRGAGLLFGLVAVLPAQTQFAAPIPRVEADVIDTHVVVPLDRSLDGSLGRSLGRLQDKKAPAWKSSFNLGATYATGNTTLRTANLAADATKKDGRNETTVNVAWNYSEQKDNTTRRWGIDQRRTAGGAKHKYFLSDAETTYGFVAVDAENNLNQAVDLRLTGTVGLGHKVIAEDDLKVAGELGVGYFLEQSRTAGVKDADFVTGRAGLEIDWQMAKDWQFLNSIKYFFSLEDNREMYGEADTRLRASIGEGMFAQAQWILQWDNTPSRKANGTRSDSIDHLFLLSIGWSF